jgi:hypothetical protein
MIHMVTYSRSPARLAARRQRGSRTSDNRQSVSLEVGKNEKFLRAEQLMINTWERALVSAPCVPPGQTSFLPPTSAPVTVPVTDVNVACHGRDVLDTPLT